MSTQATAGSLLSFDLHDHTLTACTDLDWDTMSQFKSACDQLLENPEGDLVIDLSQVEFVFSACLGVLGETISRCRSSHRGLTIRVRRSLLWMLDACGYDRLVRIDIVD